MIEINLVPEENRIYEGVELIKLKLSDLYAYLFCDRKGEFSGKETRHSLAYAAVLALTLYIAKHDHNHGGIQQQPSASSLAVPNSRVQADVPTPSVQGDAVVVEVGSGFQVQVSEITTGIENMSEIIQDRGFHKLPDDALTREEALKIAMGLHGEESKEKAQKYLESVASALAAEEDLLEEEIQKNENLLKKWKAWEAPNAAGVANQENEIRIYKHRLQMFRNLSVDIKVIRVLASATQLLDEYPGPMAAGLQQVKRRIRKQGEQKSIPVLDLAPELRGEHEYLEKKRNKLWERVQVALEKAQ